MIDIDIQRDLFGQWVAIYTDPLSEKPVKVVGSVPKNEEAHEVFKSILSRGIIGTVVDSLRTKQASYIKGLVKYTEVKKKDRDLIRIVNHTLSTAISDSNSYIDLDDYCAYVYEHIFPYLNMVKPNNTVYSRLLQFVENQCNNVFEVLPVFNKSCVGVNP